MSYRIPFLAGAFFLLAGATAHTQAVPSASHGSGVVTDSDSDVPDPVHTGWSATIGSTGAYDSLAGWSMLETPSIGYRLNRIVSTDASIPFYAYMNAVRTGKDGDSNLVGHHGVWGDAAFATHFDFSPEVFDYTGTIAVSAPTGDEHLGVGTGHMGYNENNHIERTMGVLTPEFEAAIGNTSSLLRRKVTKSYTSYGLLGFLQAGTAVALPGEFNLDTEAYEQLPIGSQTVYSRTKRKHGAVLAGTSDGEDNGVNVAVDAPPTHRLLISASFGRSIRLDDTTASLSIAFLLRVPTR